VSLRLDDPHDITLLHDRGFVASIFTAVPRVPNNARSPALTSTGNSLLVASAATNGGNFVLAGFSLAVSTAETGTHLIAFRAWADCTTGTSESEFVVHIAWLVRFRASLTVVPDTSFLHPPQVLMTAANPLASNEVVTAALLVIGGKILSGCTKDQNIGYIAEYLTALGIDLKEARVVGDEERAIVDALNALRHRYTYVFTTGGIGPTHSDVTADCVAKAFGVPIDTDPRALAILHEWVETTGAAMNEARLRMTRIPKGADLILNKVSGAPGFCIDNVIVMAGVPSIMQAMLDEVAPKLKIGVRMLSETVRADVREGDIGMQLGEIANANPAVVIGSHPFFEPEHGANTNVVLRARDAQKLAFAKRAVEDMLERVRRAQSNSARALPERVAKEDGAPSSQAP
jgi:molybdopterin-biosynthesis enzyme MoeA-like protein